MCKLSFSGYSNHVTFTGEVAEEEGVTEGARGSRGVAEVEVVVAGVAGGRA